ncbi:hypothetical protein [uncultured Jatrophihabitans sp.]|uniref:hypothetical protein n=1 Tax=uncultured Jatrophihabitans sp. TaxID=1610747 RepID=UPI0035CA1F38
MNAPDEPQDERPDDVSDEDREPVAEAPATWENVVVAKAKEALGRVVRDDELVEQGEDQEGAAREVREEWREEKHTD